MLLCQHGPKSIRNVSETPVRMLTHIGQWTKKAFPGPMNFNVSYNGQIVHNLA